MYTYIKTQNITLYTWNIHLLSVNHSSIKLEKYHSHASAFWYNNSRGKERRWELGRCWPSGSAGHVPDCEWWVSENHIHRGQIKGEILSMKALEWEHQWIHLSPVVIPLLSGIVFLFDWAGCFRRDIHEAVMEKGDLLNTMILNEVMVLPEDSHSLPLSRIPGGLLVASNN